MKGFSDIAAGRRAQNAKAIAAFGPDASSHNASSSSHIVRKGATTSLFTIGYEKRDGGELIDLLLSEGVEALVDVRERPLSRKPDFRKTALQNRCEEAGIEYIPMTELGSPSQDRKELYETGDIDAFLRKFRRLARRTMREHLAYLAQCARDRRLALLCYERLHSDCHRSVLAELVAKDIDASVIAIEG